MKIRLLLVDDQVLFVKTLRSVIESRSGDIKVVGVATSGTDALNMLERVQPHILLVDVKMPGLSGVELAQAVHDRYPSIKILMLTTFEDEEYLRGAVEAGAVGYILKDISPEDLIESLRMAFRGMDVFSDPVIRRLVRKADRNGSPAGDFSSVRSQLSAREIDILRLIKMGCDNREISDRLFISLQTVKNYVSSIYEKTGIHSRPRLIGYLADKQI